MTSKQERVTARNLQHMRADLESIYQELCPEEAAKQKQQQGQLPTLTDKELKKLDPLERGIYQLTRLTNEAEKDVRRLQAMHAAQKGERDVQSIRLSSQNRDALAHATKLFQQLTKLQQNAEKRKKASSTDAVARSRERMSELGKRIAQLGIESMVFRVSQTPAEAALEQRVQERKAQRKAQHKQRRDGADSELMEIRVVVEDEEGKGVEMVAFRAQVDRNMQQQDEMLAQIADGLGELHQMALAANKELVVGAALIAETETKMDVMIDKFKGANRRMREILDKHGGCSRWCCVIVSVVLLLTTGGAAWAMIA